MKITKDLLGQIIREEIQQLTEAAPQRKSQRKLSPGAFEQSSEYDDLLLSIEKAARKFRLKELEVCRLLTASYEEYEKGL